MKLLHYFLNLISSFKYTISDGITVVKKTFSLYISLNPIIKNFLPNVWTLPITNIQCRVSHYSMETSGHYAPQFHRQSSTSSYVEIFWICNRFLALSSRNLNIYPPDLQKNWIIPPEFLHIFLIWLITFLFLFFHCHDNHPEQTENAKLFELNLPKLSAWQSRWGRVRAPARPAPRTTRTASGPRASAGPRGGGAPRRQTSGCQRCRMCRSRHPPSDTRPSLQL